MLAESNCVLTLWTEASVDSEWVDIETREGKKRGILVPALLDPLSEKSLPLGLRQIQAADLHDWDGESPHPNLDLLLAAISRTVETEKERKRHAAAEAKRRAEEEVREAERQRKEEEAELVMTPIRRIRGP